MRHKHSHPHILVLITLLVSQVGCGGSSPGDSESGVDGGGAGNTGNNGLTGYVYSAEIEEHRLFVLDIATGDVIPTVPVPYVDTHVSPSDIYPSLDGKTFVVPDGSCAIGDRKDCVYILDETGQMVSQFKITTDFELTKPSPDGQIIAGIWENENESNPIGRLTLVTRQGKILKKTASEVTSYAWLPDGRLISVSNNTIYLSDRPHDFVGPAIRKFSADEGTPVQLSVSPDGTKVAFLLLTDQSLVSFRGHIYVMNIDGTNLRQLTDSDPNSEFEANETHPVWSPDGKWILVVNDFVGSTGAPGGYPGDLYAVPSDGIKVNLDKPDLSIVRHIKVNNPLARFKDHRITAWLPTVPPVSPVAKRSAEVTAIQSIKSSVRHTTATPQAASITGTWQNTCQPSSSAANPNYIKQILTFNRSKGQLKTQHYVDSTCSEVSQNRLSAIEPFDISESLISDSGLESVRLHWLDESTHNPSLIHLDPSGLIYIGQQNRLDFGDPWFPIGNL